MTGALRPSVVEVVADLNLDIDGRSVTVTADGQQLSVFVAEPWQLWRELNSVPLPVGVNRMSPAGLVGAVADQLAEAGLSATLSGPSGRLLSVGAAAHSPVGRLVTSSAHVRPGSWTATGSVLLSRLGQVQRRWPVALAATVVVIAVRSARRPR